MELLAARFELGPVIAEGGMGVVHRARDAHTGGDVAVKRLHEKKAFVVDRFVREAELLAKLSHAGIVGHVAHGTSADGDPWLAMEWIDGESLAARLTRGPLPIADAVALAQRLADALAHAHDLGITHRDLKPENVVLRGGALERPVLIDFGIARFAGAARATKTGLTMGTPGYMSPEQAVGERDLDARADVFSLGAVLFECVAGRPAFEGSHPMAMLAKLLIDDVPPLRTTRPDVPDALDELVASMLQRDKTLRPSDMRTIARALASIAADPGTALASMPAPRLSFAEQRLVTIVASTAPGSLDETIAPEALTMHHTEERQAVPAGGAIEREASRIAKLASGAIVALFTGDATPADQATRATRAAIAHARVTTGARVVIATGRVVVTSHVPVGEVIERAIASLFAAGSSASDAKSAGVRLDAATAGLVGERFAMRVALGALFEVIGERRIEAPLRGVLGQPTPFVGRERELALLEATFSTCAHGSTAGAVLVTAPAGLGKSRLRREIVARLEPHATVLLARGELLGAGGAYAMLGPLVRRAAGIADAEPMPAQCARLEARIASVAATNARWIAELVGELAQITFPDESSGALRAARADPRLLGDRMREAWLAWMRAEAARRPVLLVLEDLQWGDRPTVQLVESMLRDLADAPLMILALARPDVRDQFPSLWADLGATEISLAPIGKRAAQELVTSVLGTELDPAALARVVERAAGSPLFLEELTRAVASGKDELPDNVLAMAQKRLDDLEPETRRALRAASVLGARIYEGAVAEMLGDPVTAGAEARASARTKDALETLVRREILIRRSSQGLSGDVEYDFRHDILREAAYALLPPEERALAHRVAGDWLERRGIEAPVVRAEHHERGGDPIRAASAWLEAARESLAGDDLDLALARASRGIATEVEGQVAVDLQLVAALAHRWAFRPQEAEALARGALEGSRPGSVSFFKALAELTLASARSGDRVALQRWLGLSEVTESESYEATIARCEALLHGGGQATLFGEHDRAQVFLDLARKILPRPLEDEPRTAARAHLTVALIAASRGEAGAALASYRRNIDGFLAIGDVRSAVGSRINTALQEIEVGLYENGLARLEDALADAQRLRLTYILVFARSNLGLALERVGRLDEAETVLRRVIDEAGSSRGRLVGSAFIYLARVLSRRGLDDDAIETAEIAIERTEAFAPMHALALAALAGALLRAGRIDEALGAATRGAAILEELGGMEEGETVIRLAYVEALLAAGHRDRAVAAARSARVRIEERAARAGDPLVARAIVESVVENVRLLELAR